MRSLELLAPAKNLECGIAAIDHGADAVYIGASRFGARAAAGNSVEDIARLCSYARPFGVRVYVTVNTILYDAELESTRRLLLELADAGVDAVLVQDMSLLSADLRGMSLHASTQTDNRTPAKVAWLRRQGFRRVVLARELSLQEIRAVHEAVPDVELEVFVHGALCVSYSGLCYVSQHCFRRSANRGECAQFCRMAFDLLDADGRVLEHNRHLLSLKDLCQLDRLEDLADAGATSFKIEGRLKDVAYVKNVTAAYSQQLDQLVRRHPDRYCRASRGRCQYTFTPRLEKTFHRGYTHYFLDGRQPSIASFDTPKAMGEFVGTVKELRRTSFTVAGTASFANGDGLCFLRPSSSVTPGSREGQLEGFRVNRVEGNRLFPQHMPESLRPGVRLYRNQDQEMDRLLSRPSAERKIPLRLSLRPLAETGFELTATLEDGTSHRFEFPDAHQAAQTPQRDTVVRQLSKLGNTPFVCTSVELSSDFSCFIPGSRLAEWRRHMVEQLLQSFATAAEHSASPSATTAAESSAPATTEPPVSAPVYRQPHLYNISNDVSRRFYGASRLTAYEVSPEAGAMLMQCRHCLRYSLGCCVKHGGRQPSWREPLFLRLGDGRRFRLEFDCRQCQMNVYAENC